MANSKKATDSCAILKAPKGYKYSSTTDLLTTTTTTDSFSEQLCGENQLTAQVFVGPEKASFSLKRVVHPKEVPSALFLVFLHHPHVPVLRSRFQHHD